MSDDIPLHNLEAERAVLGACLVRPDAYSDAATVIVDGDWFRDAHHWIWRAMGQLHSRGMAIDLVTLRNELTSIGKLDAIGGSAYVSGLADGVPRSTNVVYYAGIVGLSAARRYLQMAAPSGSPDVLADAARRLQTLSSDDGALDPDRRQARPVSTIDEPFPKPILSLAGEEGAILSSGTVAILAGEGGMAKSALAAGLAVDVAVPGDGGGLFDVHDPAPVLILTYEDVPAVVGWRVREYAAKQRRAALEYVHVLHMAGRPLYGPIGERGRQGFYTARPGPLAGWRDLENACHAISPRVIIIDPALCAYVGEPNAAAPVREFLTALERLANGQAGGCGVLLLAHATKAARGRKDDPDPFDPGLIGGSAAWVDGVRSALAMTWRPGVSGERDIAVAKSNYGPARLVCGLDAIRTKSGSIVGFQESGVGWHEPEATSTRGNNGKRRNPVD